MRMLPTNNLDAQQERLALELQLSELRSAAERRYQSLAEAMPHIVWTATPRGEVDYFNRRFGEYTGLELVEGRRGGWLSAVHAEDSAKARRSWLEAVARGVPYQAELRLRRADGEYRRHCV